METKTYVLDTSALLAWIQGEAGSDKVSECLTSPCVLSAVNLAELATKLVDSNHVRPDRISSQLRTLGVRIASFDEPQALAAGILRSITRSKGLSLGDRACLALAQQLSAEVITADSAWMALDLPLSITNIRQL
jgi:ribonuclease VapC